MLASLCDYVPSRAHTLIMYIALVGSRDQIQLSPIAARCDCYTLICWNANEGGEDGREYTLQLSSAFLFTLSHLHHCTVPRFKLAWLVNVSCDCAEMQTL